MNVHKLIGNIASLMALADEQQDADLRRATNGGWGPLLPLRKADGSAADGLVDDQVDDEEGDDERANLYEQLAANATAIADHFASQAVSHRTSPPPAKPVRRAVKPDAAEVAEPADGPALWREADQGDLGARKRLNELGKAAVSRCLRQPRRTSLPGTR